MSQPVIEEQNQTTGAWEVIPQTPEPEKPVAAAVEADDDEPTAPVVEAAKPAEAQKPAGKPRNDPEARIAQVIAKQKEAERRAEDAERKARDLEARLAPKPQPSAPSSVADASPDPNDAAKYPGGEYDPKFLKDQARYEAKQEFREQQEAARLQHADEVKEHSFTTKAKTFSDRYGEEFQADLESGVLDKTLFEVKPFSTLTKKDHALIDAIPDSQLVQVGAQVMPFKTLVQFRCFLAEQFIDSEHAKELARYVSQPANFQRLVTLHPSLVIRELARYEERLGAASVKETAGSAPAPKPKSQVTPPIQPVRGSSQPVGDDEPGDEASDDEWYRWNQRQAKRAAR